MSKEDHADDANAFSDDHVRYIVPPLTHYDTRYANHDDLRQKEGNYSHAAVYRTIAMCGLEEYGDEENNLKETLV